MEKFNVKSHIERFPDAEGGHLSVEEQLELRTVLSLVIDQEAAEKELLSKTVS